MARKSIPKKVINEVNDYIGVLKNDKLPVDRVFIFGSYAKGTPSKWSDIDVCVVSPKFKNSWRAMEYLWSKREIKNPSYVIEPVGFSPKDFNDKLNSLVCEIKNTGVEVSVK